MLSSVDKNKTEIFIGTSIEFSIIFLKKKKKKKGSANPAGHGKQKTPE